MTLVAGFVPRRPRAWGVQGVRPAAEGVRRKLTQYAEHPTGRH